MGRGGGSGGSRGGGGSFGGSRGGGGRSGGSFGSGRGGGIFGGGSLGRGSSSGSSRPSGGSFGNQSFGGSFFGGYLGGKMSRGSSGGSGPSGRPPRDNGPSGFGCGTVILILVMIIIIFAVVSAFSSNTGSSYSSSSGLTKSTVAREALPPGSVNETDYYKDELGWIENKTELLNGLKYFYQKTGVQPYVYITNTINGSHYPSAADIEKYANDLYDKLFTDEAHLLLVFFEYTPSDYRDYYVTGTQAKTVIDTEAGDILLDYLDKYYYVSSMSESEFFGKSFSDSADRIMTVTKSPWINVFLMFGLALLVIVLFVWWRYIKRQKEIEAKRTKEILDTPIERFGNTEAQDLAKKYDDNEDENNNQ